MRKFILIAIVLLISVPMWSQEPTASAPASKEDVQELLKVMRVNTQMKLVLKNMIDAFQTGARDAMLRKMPNATEKQLAAVDKLMATGFQDFSADELIGEIVPVYQRNFTSDEVHSLVAFYSSPAGQNILDKMPKISQEAMQVGMDYGRRKMGGAMARVEVLAKELEKEDEGAKGKK